MNGLKGTLIGIYAALALLLILLNLKGCHHDTSDRGHDTIIRVDTIVQTDTVYRDTGSAAPVDTAVPEEIEGERGRLRVAILWDFPGDADVHVVQPNGKCIDYKRTSDSRTGCRKDVDNRRGGRNSVENIYWDNPANGIYAVYLHFYARNPNAPDGGAVKVVVQSSSGERSIGEKAFNSGLRAPNEWKGVCRFEYKDGQLKFLEPTSRKPAANQCVVAAHR